jgi:Protein kinase domain
MELDPDKIQARSEALVGRVLGGRYRLDAVLGIGAMGAVFRARHTGLDRDVAIKLLHKDLMASDEMRARFAREAASISKLDHPNCVRVTDFGSDDEHQFLVMELLQGAPLGEELVKPLPPRRAVAIGDDVLAGLEHAHAHGLVHRDIKPDNIFLTRDEGGKVRAKLLDFGIVKLQEQSGQQLTQMGMIFGTPHFMSPEQATGGQVDVRTDLYATGIVLYCMLTGRLPFDSEEPVKVLRQQIRDPPPPLPAELPEPLRALVEQLLAKKPEDRYATATAARTALAAARRSLEPVVEVPAPAPVSAAPITTPAGPASPSPVIMVPDHARRSWPPAWWPLSREARWIAGGIGVLVLLLTIVIASGGGDDDEVAAAPDPKAAAGGSALEALLGGKVEAVETKDDAPDEADDDAAEPTPEAGAEPSERALQASIASVDALLAAREYEAARITLGPLLAAHPDEAVLHWRMAQVLTALGGAENRAAALESHAAAITADAAMLDDEAFMAQLMVLMNDSKLRVAAVELAIDQLGSRADERLLEWLNAQTKPLDHGLRHRIIAHLEGHERGSAINRPLQLALDLWQARLTADPCEAFARALEAAMERPDSFLVGTLHNVEIPAAKAGPGEAPQACPGAAEKLVEARARHDEMFAGIDPVVPKAFRKRPARPASTNNRRQRRR